ncbi:MAG TPA: PrsW family glutamic-type intramembrane protease [Polyangiaceae bacterium]
MWFALALVPMALYLAIVFPSYRFWRRHPAADPGEERQRKRHALAALAAGVVVALPVEALVHALSAWIGVDPRAQVTGAWESMLAMLLVFAPLEEASKLAAVWPFRSRFVKAPLDGVLLGSAVALGFACVEVALLFRGATLQGHLGPFVIVRGAFATIARVFAGAVWGYALGRPLHSARRVDKVLVLAWVSATTLRGLYDHLIFGRGLASLLGSLPLLVGILVVSYLGARELVPKALPRLSGDGPLSSLLPNLPPPPSLRAMRDALRRAERPVMLHWIVFGALVTMGVIITCVVGAVVLGRRLGVDFSAVDEGEVTGAVPLVLIGISVLLAFPTSGYLVARASGADSVLEAALSTGLAIVGTLVMLGLAAPVALVFALAFAPIAFGLACAGAWVGIGGGQG